MTFSRSVVIGKFLPPHRGHKLLIDTAQEQSSLVTVIVCAKPTDPIPGDIRAGWLREIHPMARVLLIDDRYDENDTAVWAANTIQWLGGRPDAVFTSEDYGEPYALAMGCQHVLVDRARIRVPCSGTMIRANPWRWQDYLEPAVRAWYVLRVCVVGAESTGTTTLASALAQALQTVWVPEYGREYSKAKQDRGETNWTTEEFTHIASEQNRREKEAAYHSNRVLICDTNSFATRLWHRRYLGFDSAPVEKIARETVCDLYLLTGDEIPFVQDGLRDGEHLRHAMHQWFIEELTRQPVPWRLISGPHEQRLKTATDLIRETINSGNWTRKLDVRHLEGLKG